MDNQSPSAPSVGRIVHFNTESGPHAALVIAVPTDAGPTLQVCNTGGTWSTQTNVTEGTLAGQWMWPPRV